MKPFDEKKRNEYIAQIATSDKMKRETEMIVNSINIDLNIPIYRYMKWEYLKNFYSDNQHKWILVRPCMWQDKFEHFIFKGKMFYSKKMNENISISKLADQYYAQCWTSIKESSMQWQINKPHSNSCHDNSNNGEGEIWVKIQSTPKKLLEGMFYSSDNLVKDTLNLITYFIGKVEYIENHEIERFNISDSNVLMDQSGLQQVLFLLQKRKLYQEENEVRLIMQVDSDFCAEHTDNIIGRKIDNWYDLVEEIVLDPWVTTDQECEVKSFLLQLAKQEKMKPINCYKSHLNDEPKGLVPTLDI